VEVGGPLWLVSFGLGSMHLGNWANIVHGPKTFGSPKSTQTEDLHGENLQRPKYPKRTLKSSLGTKPQNRKER
jgi:hypothetical protein